MTAISSQAHLWGLSKAPSPWQEKIGWGVYDTNKRVAVTLSNVWEWDFRTVVYSCITEMRLKIIRLRIFVKTEINRQGISDWLHDILYPLEAILSTIEIALLFLDELDHRLEDNRDDMVVELENLLLSELISFEIWLLRLLRPDNKASMVSILARDLTIEIKKTRKALT